MLWLGIAYGALMLVDRFGRPVKGLRISITSSCDLSCFFCHGEGSDAGSNRIMTPGEIERIVRVAMSLGVDSVKLTGGEPMMRPDILEIVKRLGRLGLSDLSMTTNGFRLADLAEDLRRLGLKRVNISFHSTRPERYARITGLRLEEAERRHGELIEAVKKAVGVGFNPVKLNVVVVKGVNDDELDDLVSFAESIGGSSEMVVQLIELVGCGLAQGIMESYYFDLSKLEKLVAEKAVKK
ncbi:MAG TPA: GTP 3',8-cyclase MoaA, partial [Nitrososphaeria archaeon]|nr:GTP 3',8-cyclase MoaA [Nitrososphaeria archaeon]